MKLMLSIKHFNQKANTMLIDIMRTLARLGLTYRGEGENEENSNFYQIILLISQHSPIIKKIVRKHHVTYLSHESQNNTIHC